MWFFSKPPIVDTSEVIFADETGAIGWPLMCEPQIYDQGLEIVRKHLKVWALQDIAFAASNNQPIETSLVYALNNLDVKLLAFDTPRETLKTILVDTPVSHSGSRLMDAFLRIFIEAPTPALETMKGRFLYGMLYGLSKSINNVDMPSKLQWIALLKELPWVIFLPFIQEIYDTDKDVGKLTVLRASQAHATVSDHRQG